MKVFGVDSLKKIIASSKEANEVINSKGFNFLSMDELLCKPDEQHQWVVQDLLPTAGLSVLAGKPKIGKTTLVRFLALCVSRGEEFLGRKTMKGKVLYIALEEKEFEVKKHFSAMRATHNENIKVHVAV